MAGVREDLSAEGVAREQAQLAASRASVAAECERKLRALSPVPEDLAGPIAEARLALRQIEGRIAHDYASATARARGARADLESFRRAHGLRRAAHYPDSRVLQAGLLLAAAVFESLFSAALFAETDSRGLLGGAVTAIGLSGANVVLGFLAGFLGLRYLQQLQPLPKIAGAIGFALLAGLSLFLNFFAAMWRQRLATDTTAPDLGDSNAWSRIADFFGQMLALTEPQAIVLLMLGGGVWVFATLKGYSGFDDPYPDYGKMARAARDAEDERSALRADARADLEAPIDAARATLIARLDGMRGALSSMNGVYDEAAAQMTALDAAARKLDAEPPARDALDPAGAMISGARDACAQAQTSAAQGLETLLSELDAAQQRLDHAEET